MDCAVYLGYDIHRHAGQVIWERMSEGSDNDVAMGDCRLSAMAMNCTDYA